VCACACVSVHTVRRPIETIHLIYLVSCVCPCNLPLHPYVPATQFMSRPRWLRRSDCRCAGGASEGCVGVDAAARGGVVRAVSGEGTARRIHGWRGCCALSRRRTLRRQRRTCGVPGEV